MPEKDKDNIKTDLFFEGDKSLSHRAVILAGISRGTSWIKNFLNAQDTLNTLKSMEKLGVEVRESETEENFQIISKGLASFQAADQALDMGNSGTGARLLLGLISGCEGLQATIDGDDSLRKRPMARITSPLSAFGSQFDPLGHLPISVRGRSLKPIYFEEELGSAQVKSACLLAAIASQVEITLLEKKHSRDHTENMLRFIGIPIEKSQEGNTSKIRLKPPYEPSPATFDIWGDISSAAFFVAMGCLIEGSELKIRNVLLNPHRLGYIKILQRMGANIQIQEKGLRCGEKGGDLFVKYASLKNVSISPEEIPSTIDEVPILCIMAGFSQGVFEIRKAEELRRKESDRIHSLCSNMMSLGYQCEEYPDGFRLVGDPDHIPRGKVEGFFDHRIIMAFEVANQVARARFTSGEDLISFHGDQREWVQTSFPKFHQKMKMVGYS